MWLLSTSRAELHFFSHTAAVTGGYAILSHRWEGYELSFQDLQRIKDECRASGANPRDCVSPKIQGCCILAEQYGYLWLWVDSCCINKESSTELSEAVNSMFDWYTRSEVCFAYLADVSSDCVLDAPNSHFRTSVWHTRGWTLQELIAPSIVIFVSRQGDILGDKSQLASLLQDITGVPARLLSGKFTLSDYSVYVRMSWASRRHTTRVEDQAYCLLGLFGVHMAPIYGEGLRAFQRLQLEIMANSVDTSLFAWGPYLSQKDQLEVNLEYEQRSADNDHWTPYLLASSPSSFQMGLLVDYVPSILLPQQPYTLSQWDSTRESSVDRDMAVRWSNSPYAHSQLPRYTLTNYGVKCHFPVIDLESPNIMMMVLLCQTKWGEHLGLLLHKSGNPVQDGLRGLYMTGALLKSTGSVRRQARILSLGTDLTNLQLEGRPVQAHWRTIYVVPHGRRATDVAADPYTALAMNRTLEVPFAVPRWLIARITALGLTFFSSRTGLSTRMDIFRVHSSLQASEHISLHFGLCSHSHDAPRSLVHWARVYISNGIGGWSLGSAPEDVPGNHHCHEHHIDHWVERSREFGDSERTVRLSCIPSIWSMPGSMPQTMDFHIELKGRVFEEMLHSANVHIPTLEELMSMRSSHSRPPTSPLRAGSVARYFQTTSSTPTSVVGDPTITREPTVALADDNPRRSPSAGSQRTVTPRTSHISLGNSTNFSELTGDPYAADPHPHHSSSPEPEPDPEPLPEPEPTTQIIRAARLLPSVRILRSALAAVGSSAEGVIPMSRTSSKRSARDLTAGSPEKASKRQNSGAVTPSDVWSIRLPGTAESQPETWESRSEAGSRPGTEEPISVGLSENRNDSLGSVQLDTLKLDRILGLANPRNKSPTLMQSAPVTMFTPSGSKSATPYMSTPSSNTGASTAAPTVPQEPTSEVTVRKTASWPPAGTTTKALYAREWYAKGGGTAEEFEVHWSLLSDEEKAKIIPARMRQQLWHAASS